MTMFCSAADVRSYLDLNATPSTSQYTDQTIESNIRAASYTLERATGRWLADRPNVTATFTTQGRAELFIHGFRSVSSVTLQGAALLANQSYWLHEDAQATGIYLAIQLRVFRQWNTGPRPWLSNPQWFDRGLDDPYFPGNYGGGWTYSSLPNDLVIVGDGGYLDANLPEPIRQASKILAAFYTMRPASILADVAITPQGGVLNYSQMPPEIAAGLLGFVNQWRVSEAAVSVG